MENLTFFETSGQDRNSTGRRSLDVVQAKFSGIKSQTWQELFSGFDTIHGITYSSGIGFVCQLLDLFENAEIIFGCEDVISYSLQEVMAYQCKTVERLRDTAEKNKIDLASRIDSGSLRFFVARTVLSHEKIYLLSAQDGRKRVVMGSANLSHTAFSGGQRENICCLDGDDAYDWYMSCYISLRENSTDQISREALLTSDMGENLKELPVSQTVRVKKALVLEPVKELDEEVRFSLDTKDLAGKFSAAVPKPDKKGKLVISPEKIKIIQRQMDDQQSREKARQEQYPQLEILPEERLARLNGKVLDLSPPDEDIRQDVALFLEYMEGYERFHGNSQNLQRRYFEFANWFFCSPFMGFMRNAAARYHQNLLPYPIFGLIYGQSKAGKSKFLETLLIMMIGQGISLPASDFTRSGMEALRRTVKGAPIIVDDMTGARFNQHAVEIIKNDNFGVNDRLLNYPAVVISANDDVKAVAPEIIRRTVICRTQAGMTNMEVMSSTLVPIIQRNVSTALYRKYLGQMITVVNDLVREIEQEDIDRVPDILAASSEILMELLTRYSQRELPGYMRPLSLDDYFNERVTGVHAIRAIKNAWQTSRDSFEVLPKSNQLRYNAGATWEADRILKELPETLEAERSREWLVMKLDSAREFFELDFRKSWAPWKR